MVGPGFDVVMCNPPYLDRDRDPVDQTTRSREPAEALFAGSRGMRCYIELASNPALFGRAQRRLDCDGAATDGSADTVPTQALLAPGGTVLLETPGGRASQVAGVLERAGAGRWPASPAEILTDSRGMHRCLVYR